MTKLSAKQCELAAQIIEAGTCSISKESDPDYVEAAAFLFDNGVFYAAAGGNQARVAAIFRAQAERAALADKTSPPLSPVARAGKEQP